MKTANFFTRALIIIVISFIASDYAYSQSGWNTVNAAGPNRKFTAVEFLNANTGYAIGGGFGRQLIYKTTDAGTTWVNQLDRGGYNLHALGFAGDNVWVVGGNGIILHTTNGGTNWLTQSEYGNNLFGVSFINTNTGWAVGDVASTGSVILKTTNGGTNWTFMPNQIWKTLKSVRFYDANTGVISANDGKGYRTTNGGVNWIEMVSGYKEEFNSVEFANANTGWMVGNNGIIMKTINAGANWTLQPGNTNDDLNTVVFVNENTGWISGDDGIILKTTNGGTDWLIQNTGVTVDLAGLTFVNENIGYAAGEDGVILKTTTGGSVGVTTLGANVPAGYKMSQNYPNPFNPSTKIAFDIPAASNVKMLVYNSAGQMVSSLVDTRLAAGSYEVNFSGAKLSSGVYFCKIEAGEFNSVIKMTMVK